MSPTRLEKDSTAGIAEYDWIYLGLTAIIITVSYKQQEFLRIGYYVHVAADRSLTEERRKSLSPSELVEHLTRTILIDKPRITKFDINLASEEKQAGRV